MDSRKTSMPSVPMWHVWEMLSGARKQKIVINELCQKCALELDELESQAGQISIKQYADLISLTQKAMGDEFIGFLNKKVPLHSFAVWCYTLAGAHRPEEFMKLSNHFIRLFTDQVHWSWQNQGESIELELHFKLTEGVDNRFLIQALLLMPIRLIGWLIGENIPISQARFEFPNLNRGQHESIGFGSDISYASGRNSIYIPKDCWNSYGSCDHQQVETLLHDTRGLFLFRQDIKPFSRSVRRLLMDSRQHGWLTQQQVASKLGITEHTLWRKLKRENNSYGDIREQLKFEWAKELLVESEMSIAEIAQRLGFSEISSFHRAFKKWTTLTPGQYRKTATLHDSKN